LVGTGGVMQVPTATRTIMLVGRKDVGRSMYPNCYSNDHDTATEGTKKFHVPASQLPTYEIIFGMTIQLYK